MHVYCSTFLVVVIMFCTKSFMHLHFLIIVFKENKLAAKNSKEENYLDLETSYRTETFHHYFTIYLNSSPL